MKNPTVYYVTTDYPPDGNAGSARARETVAGLAKTMRVIVLTHRGATPVGSEELRRLPVQNPQNESRFVRRIFREVFFTFIAYFHLLFVPNSTTIIITSPAFLPCLLFILLPRRNSVKYVLDIRDLYPDVFLHAGILKETSFLYRLLTNIERRAYANSDLILCVCDSHKQRITKRCPETPVEVVMNGYGKEFDRDSSTADLPGNPPPLRILAHGNFGRFQNIDLINELIQATSHLPIKYRFVGFGAKISKIVQAPNVQIDGPMPPAQLPALLSRVHLGLSFRTSDEIGRNAIPVKLLEYVGMGLPALVVPVMPDLNTLAKTGAIRQFEADQIPQMVNFLEELIEQPERYLALCSTVLRVRDAYSRSNHVGKAVRLINELSPKTCQAKS